MKHTPAAAAPRARRSLLDAPAARRIAATGILVACAAALAVGLARRELAASERAFAVEAAPTVDDERVSRYRLRPHAPDGSVLEARFWVGTDREYAVVLVAGARATVPVRDPLPAAAASLPALARVWERPPTDRVRDAHRAGPGSVPRDTPRDIDLGAHGRWTWSLFDEPCPGGVTTSWRLCDAAEPNAAGRCVVAPAPTACWRGPLALEAVYVAGDTLWVVAERAMGPRTTARMAAGTPLGG